MGERRAECRARGGAHLSGPTRRRGDRDGRPHRERHDHRLSHQAADELQAGDRVTDTRSGPAGDHPEPRSISSRHAASTSSRSSAGDSIAIGSMNIVIANEPAYDIAVTLNAVPASGPKA